MQEENFADARALSSMLMLLDTLPCATIALVQGPAFGGGVGLVSCCDMAVGVGFGGFRLGRTFALLSFCLVKPVFVFFCPPPFRLLTISLPPYISSPSLPTPSYQYVCISLLPPSASPPSTLHLLTDGQGIVYAL